MTVLYIIGNGFDLRHGLPTRWSKFDKYAKGKLDDVIRYFDCPEIDSPWSDFESSLGTYNWQELFDEWNFTDPTSDSFKVSHTYSLEDELTERADELHRSIQECFSEWIEGIDITSASKQMVFETEARFISFNYTAILQLVYGIDDSRILHIHGKAERDDILFGHGVDIVDESDLDENGDSNRTIFTDSKNAAKYPLSAFQKPTSEILQKNREYFGKLCDLERIEVIGHSMADVDLPYFKEIASQSNGCEWIVYCYREGEPAHMIQQLEKCGVDPAMIQTRSYPTI